MRISDWSSDVCSSDLAAHNGPVLRGHDPLGVALGRFRGSEAGARVTTRWRSFEGTAIWAEGRLEEAGGLNGWRRGVLRVAGWPTLVYDRPPGLPCDAEVRSEEHTSELQSLMRISYAVFCLKKKKQL